jgi:hypothetical protein
MEAMTDPGTERDALWVGVLGALALALGAAPDVGYGDAGELGTAAVVLGVAHPTGFAFDLLWLKAASLVPLGSLAFRLNTATALAGGAALGLCAAVIARIAIRAGVRDPLARRAGVALGVSGLYGSAIFAAATQAVEVYALALCAVLLAVYFALVGGRGERALAVLVGLAFGLHVTAGLYAAPVLLACAFRAPRLGRFIATRAPLLLAAALVLAYLPLASRRDPPIDWGDPETLSGVLGHLTAQRIRDAYQAELFGGNASAPMLLLSQLSGLGGLLMLALGVALASSWMARAQQTSEPRPATGPRVALLGVALLGCLDLAYALLINPMGVRDLQCGHVTAACLAILGGVAGAVLLQAFAERRAPRLAVAALLVSLAIAQLAPSVLRSEQDGYALAELFGSGGLTTALPPRTLFLCSTDNACAAGMFALIVERVRPDMDVAPAQHLWDATVLRQIEGLAVPAAQHAAERGARALANTRALIGGAARRPLAFELRKTAVEVDKGGRLGPLQDGAFVAPVGAVSPDAFARARRLLDRALHSRFVAPPGDSAAAAPSDERARLAWSRVYGELGAVASQSPAIRDGVGALERAVQLAPERATAWNNLGVALESLGQLDAAIEVTKRALQLEPTGATSWVNLARLEQTRGDVAAARKVLKLAADAGVEDPRLRALGLELSAP